MKNKVPFPLIDNNAELEHLQGILNAQKWRSDNGSESTTKSRSEAQVSALERRINVLVAAIERDNVIRPIIVNQLIPKMDAEVDEEISHQARLIAVRAERQYMNEVFERVQEDN